MAATEEAVAPAEEAAVPAVALVADAKKRKKAASPKEKKKPAKGKDQKASHPPYFQVWPWCDPPTFLFTQIQFQSSNWSGLVVLLVKVVVLKLELLLVHCFLGWKSEYCSSN